MLKIKPFKINPFSNEIFSCPFCLNSEIQLSEVPTERGVVFVASCSVCEAKAQEYLSQRMAIKLRDERYNTASESSGVSP